MSCYDNQYVSVKMRNLSVIAMIAVVVIHSVTYTKLPRASTWNSFVQNLLCGELARFAVPLFYLMSGYWFSKGRYFQGKEDWKSFARNKVRTLLVPYVLWCILATVLVLPLILADNWIQGRGLWTHTAWAESGLFGKLDFIFAFNRLLPGDGPLWYVRQLLILFAVAPLWKLFANQLGVCLLGIGWGIETLICPMGFGSLHLTSMAIGWFSAGIVVGRRGWEYFALSRKWIWSLGGLWVSMSCLCAAIDIGLLNVSRGWSDHLSRAVPVCGVAFVWVAYNLIDHNVLQFPSHLRQTFFNYCFHMIPGTYFISVSLFLVRKNDLGSFVVFLLAPFVMLAFCGACSSWMKRLVPCLYATLTGGRG